MTEQTSGDQSERLAEELRLLVDAFTQRAEHCLRHTDETAGESGRVACDWCPLCAVITAGRSGQFELVGRWAGQLADMVTALRQSLASEQDHAPGPAPETESETPAVRRIEVQRVHRNVVGENARSASC